MLDFENPYCSLEQVQQELRNTEVVAEETIEDAIIQISRYIDDIKGRDYFQHDHSVTALELDKYDTDKIIGDTIFLPYTPIITLTSVTVAGRIWTRDADYIVKSNGTDARLIAVGNYWMTGNWYGLAPTDKISILGVFGYAQAAITDVPTGIPGFINKAAVVGAAALSGHNQKEVLGMDGAKSAVYDKNLPRSFWDLVGPRRTML